MGEFCLSAGLYFVDTHLVAGTLSKCLSHVYCWLCLNKLSLSISKTQKVIFNISKYINLNELHNITLNNDAVEKKETVTFLEVYLDEGQNWKFRINKILKRMAQLPPVLLRTNLCFDTSSKKFI